MKYFSRSQLPSFNAKSVTDTIERALSSAGIDTSNGPMRGVTDTIRRALSSAGLKTSTPSPATDASVVDVAARVVGGAENAEGQRQHGPVARDNVEAPGAFVTRQYSNQAGSRAYKLYVPAKAAAAEPLPVVVMLHGCTQSADDFAAGTQMNRLADEHGFLVLYPEQAPNANASKCWNWFQTQDQMRDAGEPSLIAGMVREVVVRDGADPRRVFVAGLSAGAAMALVLGETYPELFSGVGVHSGLPYGSAHDVPSALAAMKGGRSGMPSMQGLQGLPGASAAPRRKAAQAVPLIVFHGDRDHTVQHSNGAEIIQQAIDAHVAEAGVPLQARVEQGCAPGGRRFSRTVHLDASGQHRLESWTVHGAGHAWSGGHAGGSYTDATGPDASAEMVRFFLGQPRAGSA